MQTENLVGPYVGRIYRAKQAAAYLSVSRATLHRLRAAKDFPAPVRLGPNSVGWTKESLDAWIDARQHAPAKH